MKNKKIDIRPVENHNTAAWSNIDEIDENSKVAHPNLSQTVNAKDYVDNNQK